MDSRRLAVQIALGVTALACFAAAYEAAWLSYADILFSKDTLRSVRAAVTMVPCNARYRVRYAALLRSSGDERRASIELSEARKSSPHDSAILIALALDKEAQGDVGAAERLLVEAAAVDRMYDARWTLANFYFRHEKWCEFEKWARLASQAGELRDLAPLFRLMAAHAADPNEPLLTLLPRRRPVLRKYLAYSLEGAPASVSGQAARALLLAGAEAADRELLLRACDRLLAAGDVDPALEIWNVAASHEFIERRPLSPLAGLSLTNGDFRSEPLAKGFDWRPAVSVAVTSSRTDADFRMELSGKQPERIELLSQYVPVAEERSYRLTASWRTLDNAPLHGLKWRVLEVPAGATLAETSRPGASAEFTASRPLVRISAVYERELGTTRFEGTIIFEGVTLEKIR